MCLPGMPGTYDRLILLQRERSSVLSIQFHQVSRGVDISHFLFAIELFGE